MKIEQGKQAVWAHAGEAGMQDDIRLISKHFDIQDISIIFNGKMTFIENRPRKMHRVPAVPTPSSHEGMLNKILKDLRAKK